MRGRWEPTQADVVRDVLGLYVECGDGRHAELACDPLCGTAQRPRLVDVDGIGALDRRDEYFSIGFGEHGVLAMREATRDRHHELRNPEHFGSLPPLHGRVTRIAARDHAHRVPSRDKALCEPHRRYGGSVVVDIERVDDQRDDHAGRRSRVVPCRPTPLADLFNFARLIDLARWAANHFGGVGSGEIGEPQGSGRSARPAGAGWDRADRGPQRKPPD